MEVTPHVELRVCSVRYSTLTLTICAPAHVRHLVQIKSTQAQANVGKFYTLHSLEMCEVRKWNGV